MRKRDSTTAPLAGEEPATSRRTSREDSGARVSDVFSLDMVVDPSDIDDLGHASNVAYVRWVQSVARAHSEHVGLTHARYVELGMVFVVRRHEIDYLRPVKAADRLHLKTWIQNFKAASSTRRTEVMIADEDVVVARASTKWALVSLATAFPVRIPQELQDAFARTDGAA